MRGGAAEKGASITYFVWIESKREIKSCGSADDKSQTSCAFYAFKDGVLTRISEGDEKPEVLPKPLPPAGSTIP